MAAGNNKGLVRVVINHPLFLIGLKATVGVVQVSRSFSAEILLSKEKLLYSYTY